MIAALPRSKARILTRSHSPRRCDYWRRTKLTVERRLMLHSLQTASANLKHTSFEPKPARAVSDPECVERRPVRCDGARTTLFTVSTA